MRLKHMVAAVAAACSTGVMAQPVTSGLEALDTCIAKVQAQTEVRPCLEEKLKESERILGEAERTLHASLDKWSEKQGWTSATRTGLATTYETFKPYRNAVCNTTSLFGDTTKIGTAELRRLACIVQLTDVQSMMYAVLMEARPAD